MKKLNALTVVKSSSPLTEPLIFAPNVKLKQPSVKLVGLLNVKVALTNLDLQKPI